MMPSYLPLTDMANRHPGLTQPIATSYLEAARVCLDRHHSSPTEFVVRNGTETVSVLVEWAATDERVRGAWANHIDTTEGGPMTWADYHTQSEGFAADAEVAARQGAIEHSMALYKLAAQAEAHALAKLDVTKTRTLGITAVSAVALWYKARDYPQAQRIAHQWLGTDLLPPFAVEQLQGLLQTMRH